MSDEAKAVGLGALVEALAKARDEIKAPTKTKTGKVSGTTKAGKFYEYEYKYADRADVIEAYRVALSKHGLILTHGLETIGDSLNMVLCSRLLHTGGGELVSRAPIPQTKDAQSLGSWLTYMERYASCALLDIAAEDDDDGKRAGMRGKDAKRQDAPKSAAPPVVATAPDFPVITDAQADAIRAGAKAAGLKTLGQLKDALRKFAGTDDMARVPADKFEHVMVQLDLLNAPAEPKPLTVLPSGRVFDDPNVPLEPPDPFAEPDGLNS